MSGDWINLAAGVALAVWIIRKAREWRRKGY